MWSSSRSLITTLTELHRLLTYPKGTQASYGTRRPSVVATVGRHFTLTSHCVTDGWGVGLEVGVGVVGTGGVSETYTVNVDCLLSQQYIENC